MKYDRYKGRNGVSQNLYDRLNFIYTKACDYRETGNMIMERYVVLDPSYE